MLQFLVQAAPMIAGLIGQNKANKAIKKNNVATPAEKQAQAIYAALADPNSQLFQQMADAEYADSLPAFQQHITEMQLADRRAQALGRSPTFFNPERADEAVSYLTSRGLPGLRTQAKSNAQTRLLNAASGYSQTIPYQVSRQRINRDNAIDNASYGSQLPQQIMNMFGGGVDPRWVGNIFYG